jgi:S-adenosylmethionine decarboxylase
MGKHYLLNLYECSSSLLDDELFLVDLIQRAAIASGATILKTVSHKFDPVGVTAIVLLAESHISVHSWPEERKAACDVYTCSKTDPKIGCDLIIEELQSQSHTLSYIER